MAMQHSRQDAIDTATRRASSPNHWHPLLAAREVEPGVWYMVDTVERCYGIVRLLRRGGELGYRAVTWAELSEDRQLIGYYCTLRAATMAAHMRFVRGHGNAGPVNGR